MEPLCKVSLLAGLSAGGPTGEPADGGSQAPLFPSPRRHLNGQQNRGKRRGGLLLSRLWSRRGDDSITALSRRGGEEEKGIRDHISSSFRRSGA